MPLAEPNSGESEKEFIDRCMGDDTMVEEFPDESKRRAVCQKQWDERNDNMEKELRIDQGHIEDYRYDEEEGVLTADVKLIKSQVLPYVGDNGQIIKELVHPDHLKEDSWLDSIKTKPVTDLHPEEHVDYDNMGKYAKGNLHNQDPDVRENGEVEIWSKETIYDQDLIQDILSGTKKQVSVGRFVKVIDDSGEYKGDKYEKIQTDMTFNHLAHVPKGRAGEDVEIKLDGGMMSIKTDITEDASMPSYNGTEDKDWSAVSKDFAAFKSALDISADKSWDDLTDSQQEEIQGHFIDPSGESFTDNGYPVVNPASGKLNRGAVRSAKGYAPSGSDIEQMADRLWDKHFETEDTGAGISISTSTKKYKAGDDTMKLTIGDKELELEPKSDEQEEEINGFQDEIDERLHELKDKDDTIKELEEKMDNKEDETEKKDKKIGKLEGRIDTLEDKVENDTTEEILDEKLQLVDTVREVMPNYDWHGKSASEMKKDLIEAVFEDVDLEDKSDAYVDGRFDAALETIENGNRKPVLKTSKEDQNDELAELKEKRKNLYEG
mgnify:CR=1 FL=1